LWYNIAMALRRKLKGFTLIEVVIATAVFLLFAIGVYGGLQLIFKIVYQSRLRILETSILSAELETVRNLPFDQVGISGGLPAGVLPHTKNITRNGILFNITATVRNIDDPFDGTIGGNPNDTSPADYKLVEMAIICDNCIQQAPVILNTMVSPKGLEGASQNGALFIHVFDSNGQPVSSTNVHVVNTNPNPDLIIDDTTGNDGWLKIVDTPTGTLCYNITVSKAGYSTDGTIAPVKLPATIATQTVTEIFFSIDRLSSLNIHTVSHACAPVGNASFNMHGEKLIGTNPDVYKYSHNFSTDGAGNKELADLEWDKYHLDFSSSGYDIGGSAPMLPLKLNPGATQDLTIILRTHKDDSLLVKVNDAGTGLPLSGAAVRLTDGGSYDKSLTTGLGYTRQTDWSGGGGQADFSVTNQYFADSGTLDNDSPVGDLKLKRSGNHYLNSGWLESSTIDLGAAVNFNSLIWEPFDQPAQAGINALTFQLATSDIPDPAGWDFVGPDGTAGTYYAISDNTIWNGHNGDRFLRYKTYLNTVNDSFTPQLSEVSLTYVNQCSPPGQSFFNDVDSGLYNLEVSHDGYITNSGPIDILGNTDIEVNLSVNE